MKNLITLIKMQLKEKLNTARFQFSAKKIITSALTWIVYILKFVLATALCAIGLITAAAFPIFDDFGGVPDTFMSFLLSVMLLVSVCSCTARLTAAMYFSKDNAVLLTLPASPMQVYLSKLIIFFIFELKKNFSFLVPLFAAYFIVCGHSFIFYPWLLMVFVVLSLFTVSLAALLSIPTMWFITVFRQNKLLQTIAIILAVIGAAAALFGVLSIIPDNLDLRTGWDALSSDINAALDGFAESFSPLYSLALLIVGEPVLQNGIYVTALPPLATLGRFFTLLLFTALFFGAGLLIVRPFFYTMASKPFEYLKRAVNPKKNLALNSKISPVYNEFLKTFKDSTRLFTNIGIMIAMPSLTYLLNRLFSAMNTNETGDSMIIAFNLLIILLISLNASSYAASIYSRDGRAAYLIKAQPKNPTSLLVAKLVPTTAFCIVSFISTFIVLLETTNLEFHETVFLMLGIIFIYLAHLFYSAELDILKPHTEIYAAMGEYENDPNEIKSTSAAFALSFLVAGVTLLFLISLKDGLLYFKLFFVGLLAFLYRAYHFFSGIRLFYKER